ncbi:MAG: tyrosine--tRNA ligase [archaeon]|nr:tyrosine--tRNA ligase [archaeon]
MTLSIDERMELIKQVGEEIISIDDLEKMLKHKLDNNLPIYAYDGFEPSGRIHIAQGLLRSINVNKLTKAGIKFKFFVADWHAAANNKFGGNLEVIKKIGEYFVEVWRACNMDLENVEFLWASDLVKDPKYWEMVLNISIKTSLKRALRCTQIMGRSEQDDLSSSQILYPMMQCADIFYMNVDICQLGLDQRKVNMLAREVSKHFNKPKPIAIHHHMLAGLKQPPASDLNTVEKSIERKMSKSNPDSAIFMLDTEDDINRKIKKAWCPAKLIDGNPILEYCKYIIFEKIPEMTIKRPEKYGGDLTLKSYNELENIYANGDLSPMDLKPTVAKLINELVKPVREHFESDPHAKELADYVNKAQKDYKKKK